MKKRNYIIGLFLMFCIGFETSVVAQKNTFLETTALEIKNNQLFIYYKISNSNSRQRFRVSVNITGAKGEIIEAKSLTGDIGENITGGIDKQIVWDLIADEVYIDEDIDVEVTATLTNTLPSLGKVFSRSLIFPGLGHSKITDRKPYWIMGIAGYGCLGASLIFNNMSAQTYDDYLASYDFDESDDLYDSSIQQKKISNALLISGASIWIIDLVWTGLDFKNIRKNVNHGNISLKTAYNPQFKAPVFVFNYKF